MRIAMFGTRGVPARYGGFETAIEEVGKRLAAGGHEVTVYCRETDVVDAGHEYEGMHRRVVPALRSKALETLSHTAISSIDQLRRERFDVAFVFNSANVIFLPLIRRRGTRVAVHVDGLEWQRSKWGGVGRRYYRFAEALSVRWADALIADAGGIADYYDEEFAASTEQIAYGAAVLHDLGTGGLAEFGVEPNGFHLVVARFEPENNVDVIVRSYAQSAATKPLIVIGSAPYADEYSAKISALADGDPRIRLVGAVWDQEQLDQLYAHAATYLHGHSVGGTNPSLLRAMGVGTAVIAYDVVFNRETLGDSGRFFSDASSLAAAVAESEADPVATALRGRRSQEIVGDEYQWDAVATAYEELARRLADGESRRGEVSGRRSS